jgi:hypothetical protein
VYEDGSAEDATLKRSGWVRSVARGPSQRSRRTCVHPAGVEIDVSTPLRELKAATMRSPGWTFAGRAIVSDEADAAVAAVAALTNCGDVEGSSASAGTATTIAPRIAHVASKRARRIAWVMAAFMPLGSTSTSHRCPL